MADQMSEEEYAATQAQLLAAAQVIDTLDLAGLVSKISHADAVGPILDPTLYRRGMRRMHAIGRVAVAAQQVQRAQRELRAVIEAEQ